MRELKPKLVAAMIKPAHQQLKVNKIEDITLVEIQIKASLTRQS